MDEGTGHRGGQRHRQAQRSGAMSQAGRRADTPCWAGPENTEGMAEVNNMDLLGFFGDRFEL